MMRKSQKHRERRRRLAAHKASAQKAKAPLQPPLLDHDLGLPPRMVL
jgi:hypothetical protein